MKISIFLAFLAFVLPSSVTAQVQGQDVENIIIENAKLDGINFDVLDPTLFNNAMTSIVAIYVAANITPVPETGAPSKRSNSRIFSRETTAMVDVHGHVVPSWYHAAVPTTGGNPTPTWDLQTHLAFMQSEGITHSIISFSTPGANVFQGNQNPTVALARLMNEQLAAYCRQNPDQFSFYATVPLPFTQESITEANYALNNLGAVGIAVQSNYDGKYLGNAELAPFLQWLNGRSDKEILFVHPGDPVLNVGGNLVSANPTLYASGTVEFYFETARTLMDLILSGTLASLSNIHYVIPHVGGAFPASLDRFLKTDPPIYDSTMAILQARVWWDSAGPTYFHQVEGLLGYDTPISQLLFGTDYPYAPAFTQAGSLAAVEDSTLITAADKTALFSTNPQSLFAGKITF